MPSLPVWWLHHQIPLHVIWCWLDMEKKQKKPNKKPNPVLENVQKGGKSSMAQIDIMVSKSIEALRGESR